LQSLARQNEVFVSGEHEQRPRVRELSKQKEECQSLGAHTPPNDVHKTPGLDIGHGSLQGKNVQDPVKETPESNPIQQPEIHLNKKGDMEKKQDIPIPQNAENAQIQMLENVSVEAGDNKSENNPDVMKESDGKSKTKHISKHSETDSAAEAIQNLLEAIPKKVADNIMEQKMGEELNHEETKSLEIEAMQGTVETATGANKTEGEDDNDESDESSSEDDGPGNSSEHDETSSTEMSGAKKRKSKQRGPGSAKEKSKKKREHKKNKNATLGNLTVFDEKHDLGIDEQKQTETSKSRKDDYNKSVVQDSSPTKSISSVGSSEKQVFGTGKPKPAEDPRASDQAAAASATSGPTFFNTNNQVSTTKPVEAKVNFNPHLINLCKKTLFWFMVNNMTFLCSSKVIKK